MDRVDVIMGQDLIRYKKYTDFSKAFTNKLDPGGYNIVVSDETIDGDTKLLMLFKILDQEEPFEGNLMLPYIIYKQIKHRISLGDVNVH